MYYTPLLYNIAVYALYVVLKIEQALEPVAQASQLWDQVDTDACANYIRKMYLLIMWSRSNLHYGPHVCYIM